MPIFKDIWKGATRPDKPNEFLTQFAQQLMMGGGSQGPIARMGNKLIGGLLHSGQRGGAMRQEALKKEQRSGILSKLFAQPTGPGTLLQAGTKQLLPETGGILGGPQGAPLTGGDSASGLLAESLMTPELYGAVTDIQTPEGAIKGLTDKQRGLGKISVEMINSDDEGMQALGAAMFKKAMFDDKGYDIVGNNIVITGPDGKPTFISPPSARPPITVPAGGSVIDFRRQPDGTIKEVRYEGNEKPKTTQRGKEIETRLNEDGYMEERTRSWEWGSGNTELNKRFSEWQPASKQTVEGQMLSADTVYKRGLQQEQDAAMKLDKTYDNIKAKIDDPVHGSEYLDLFTAQGKIDQFFRGARAFFKITDENDADFQKARRGYAFMSDVQDAANRYIKEITGAQMSEAEATRLLKAIANSNDNKAAFMGKLDAQMARIKEMVAFSQERIKTLMGRGMSATDATELVKGEVQGDIKSMIDEVEAEADARVTLRRP